MKNLFKVIKEIWTVDELKKRIIYTLSLILVYRIGSYIVLPGIDVEQLNASGGADNSILNLINMFAGGAFSRASIMALGIMPYISASIVMQLLGMAVPTFQRLQREGESGRKKINQYTRILTILICLFQSPSYMWAYVGSSVELPSFAQSPLFWIQTVSILTAGTMFVTWLGERITDRGIGNGISLIITIGIIAGLPGAFFQELGAKIYDGGLVILLVELVILLVVILVTILLVQGTRRIPVHTAKRVIGRGSRQALAGGQRSYIPLKINQAGVMPIIFAQALMFLPSLIFQNTSFGATFSNIQGFWYNAVFFLLIVIFTYFYTAIMMNPNQMADELKKWFFYSRSKTGKKDSRFYRWFNFKVGIPRIYFSWNYSYFTCFCNEFWCSARISYFFGGTSLLIMVGVVLDTLQLKVTF